MNASSHPARAADADLSQTVVQGPAEQGRAAALSQPRVTPPASVPGYDVERPLGNGAFGTVWLAAERNTGKQVAIKFYSHRRGIDWSLLNREVEKLAALYTSRDIVGLLQVGWDADPPYYVMEYLQNGSLSRLLEQGTLPVEEAVRIATAVNRALGHAHQQGILHCDVKPANVLLDGDWAPRLADFGQARLSHEQSPALGTLYYMAPEQADLAAVPDPRWDVYALGALLYHMLCGEPPFRTPEHERHLQETGPLEEKLAAYRRLVEQGPRPSGHRARRGVDARLAEIVDRCLAANPAARFRSATEVADALAARARQRSLRPLIWLGIVLPGVLLLALFPLAVMAVRSAAATAERNIAERALESDAVSAKILAYSLNDDLTQRIRTLSQIADDPELRGLMPGATRPADSEERRALHKWLSIAKGEIDQIRRESNSDLDESWLLSDAEGFQRWREPASDVTYDEHFGWRDYFHGQGADHPEWKGRPDIPPIQAPHISAPFRSLASGQFKISLSVPVRDVQQRVIGVLSRSVQLGKLLGSYKQLVGENWRDREGERVLALLDLRAGGGRVLDHPWMVAENLQSLSDERFFAQLTLRPEQQARLLALQQLVRGQQPIEGQNVDTQYYDPIAEADEAARAKFGMPWLAAFWPVGETGWMAVVQERRADALDPVREIQEGLAKYALTGLALSLTLVATSWYFVRRAAK
ncbi:MAG: serine/threonine protein kinase [Planctomycetales bacterium]